MQTWKYLTTEKQAVAIGALCEGNSIRSVERMTGIHRDTVMRLGVRVGMACRNLMDETMRELPCGKIELDEIWGFIGKKQRNVTETDSKELGDVWTWVAIDPESKAVPVFHVGKREASDASAFVRTTIIRTLPDNQRSKVSRVHELRRTAKPDDAHAHEASRSAHALVLKEAGKL